MKDSAAIIMGFRVPLTWIACQNCQNWTAREYRMKWRTIFSTKKNRIEINTIDKFSVFRTASATAPWKKKWSLWSTRSTVEKIAKNKLMLSLIEPRKLLLRILATNFLSLECISSTNYWLRKNSSMENPYSKWKTALINWSKGFKKN